MNKGGTSDDVIVFYVTTSINGGERPRLDRARSRRNFRENWNKGRAMGHRVFRSIDDKTFFNDIEGINLRNDLVSRSGITGLMERRCRGEQDIHRGVDSGDRSKYKCPLQFLTRQGADYSNLFILLDITFKFCVNV